MSQQLPSLPSTGLLNVAHEYQSLEPDQQFTRSAQSPSTSSHRIVTGHAHTPSKAFYSQHRVMTPVSCEASSPSAESNSDAYISSAASTPQIQTLSVRSARDLARHRQRSAWNEGYCQICRSSPCRRTKRCKDQKKQRKEKASRQDLRDIVLFMQDLCTCIGVKIDTPEQTASNKTSSGLKYNKHTILSVMVGICAALVQKGLEAAMRAGKEHEFRAGLQEIADRCQGPTDDPRAGTFWEGADPPCERTEGRKHCAVHEYHEDTPNWADCRSACVHARFQLNKEEFRQRHC